MDRPAHYHSFVKKPHPLSRYAFHYDCNRVLDDEPRPGMWLEPVAISDDMDVPTRQYWERLNPVLASARRTDREGVISLLQGAGLPETAFAEPMTDGAKALLHQMLYDQRARWMHLEQRMQQPMKPLLEPYVAILVAARFTRGGNRSAAIFLNEGIPPASGQRGLVSDHITRAWKKCWQPGSVTRSRVGFAVAISCALNRFRVLELVRTEAGKTPRYKGLRGSALAAAIYNERDLAEVFHRAETRLERCGQLIEPILLAA